MAKTHAVWGIDIGQCALKALRCTWDEKSEQVVADAYDFIEYPKILSQPDANPAELVKEALEQFLSRNDIRGDEVCISVSGQAGLSRFFKPPPVDIKTLPRVVEFEAKQQIPFPLEEVIWDFQKLSGMVVDGLILDGEVGIFAMKREAVYRALQPYTDSDVEVDVVQLAPLATYNFILHEVLTDVPEEDEIDPDDPPHSMVVLSIGTDTTDLVITDGHKLWMRNIPIGGSHFTKQLSRDLKLTYAKAEHLKRNARKAEDPKTIFQAMRPVFSDFVTEIQRSLNFFQGIEKKATLGKIAMLGNAGKLPGLRQYLAQNLGSEIIKLNSYPKLAGEAVGQPTFEKNFLSFSVCYGLCLQGLKKSRIKTNLLPREFKIERMVRAKKPWALASVGVLMLAFAVSLLFKGYSAWRVDDKRVVDGVTWVDAEKKASEVKKVSDTFLEEHKQDKAELEKVKALIDEIAGQNDGRRLWPELLSVISQTLPQDPRISSDSIADPEKVPFEDRNLIYIEKIDSQYFKDLGKWFNAEMQEQYKVELRESDVALKSRPGAKGRGKGKKAGAESAEAADPSQPDVNQALQPGSSTATSSGDGTNAEAPNEFTGKSGWVVEIKAHHWRNSEARTRAGENTREAYVRAEWLNNMRTARVQLPGSAAKFTLEELGINHIVLAKAEPLTYPEIPNLLHPKNKFVRKDDDESGGGGKSAMNNMDMMKEMGKGGGGGAGKQKEGEADKENSKIKQFYRVGQFDFTVQFVWQPVGLNARLEMLKERTKKREERAKAKAAEGGGEAPETESTEE